jgi:hypothetical protein
VTKRPVPAPADAADLATYGNKWYYEVTLSNKGGLVMPLILEWTYEDGTKDVDRVPAEIWRLNENQVTKVFIKDKKVVRLRQDPMRETADINEGNNVWPAKDVAPTNFQLYKGGFRNRSAGAGAPNPMQRQLN